MAPARGHLSGIQVSNTGPSWPSCFLSVLETKESGSGQGLGCMEGGTTIAT